MGPALIKIIFFIAANIVPPGEAEFAIATPEGESVVFARQEGGWKPSPVPDGESGTWSLTGNMLRIMGPDGGSGLRMDQFFSDLGTIDWHRVTELTQHKTPIKLIRNDSEVVVLHGQGPKVRKYVISW